MQKNIFSRIAYFIFIKIIFFSALSVSYAQSKIFTPSEIKADMATLKQKFEKLHPGMYYYESQANYEKLYDSLYLAANKPMTFIEAYQHLAPLVLMIKDGHTNILYGSKYFPKKTKKVPFYVRKLENGYFLSINQSKDSTILRGSEIKTINDEPIEAIIYRIKKYISVDNDNETARLYFATNNFPNAYLRIYGESDSVKITYRLPDSTQWQTKKVACLADVEMTKISAKRYKSLNRPNMGLKILDSLHRIAILDITSFSMKGKFDPFQSKFKRALKERFLSIQKNKIEHLIIDFRGNGGGFIPNISRLLRYLSPQPFTLMQKYGFKKSAYFTVAPPYFITLPMFMWAFFPKRENKFMLKENVNFGGNQPQKHLGFRGKIYFIIDPGCYSATTFTLALAKDLGIGEAYIGQQVGGASWGSFAANWRDFKLPHTKFTIHTPLYRIEHKLNQPVDNFFLQPTYEVGRNEEELRKNNSNAINFTLNMIQKSIVEGGK
jgi:hypothetical protein